MELEAGTQKKAPQASGAASTDVNSSSPPQASPPQKKRDDSLRITYEKRLMRQRGGPAAPHIHPNPPASAPSLSTSPFFAASPVGRPTPPYVCVCPSVVQTGIWSPRSPSLRLAPPPPNGNGCSGSSVLCGFCSASRRLQQRADVRFLKRRLTLLISFHFFSDSCSELRAQLGSRCREIMT